MMEIPGFTLQLQDYCEHCPNFAAEVETITAASLMNPCPSAHHNIRCVNGEQCVNIVGNPRKWVACHE